MKARCFSCMGEMTPRQRICPHCGYRKGNPPEEPFFIVPGTIIRDRYMVGEVISFTGFSISYVGWDDELDTKVEIKEYYPEKYASRTEGDVKVIPQEKGFSTEFSKGLAAFMSESILLSEVTEEAGIIKLLDYFSDNNTAYAVFEYPDGETLSSFLDREGVLPEDYAVNLLTPVIQSLQVCHEKGLIHRDINPDNIFLTKDGDVKLINFGTYGYGLQENGVEDDEVEISGYASPERYWAESEQDASMDIYSLGATLYKMVTGRTPTDGQERISVFAKSGRDILMPPARIKTDISDAINDGVLAAMAMEKRDRIESSLAFLKMINPTLDIFAENEEQYDAEDQKDETSYEDSENVRIISPAKPVTPGPKKHDLSQNDFNANELKKAPAFIPPDGGKPIRSYEVREKRGVPRWIKFLLPAVLIVGLFALGLYSIPKKFEKEPVKETPSETAPVVEEKKEDEPKEEKKEEPKIVEVPNLIGMKKAEMEETLKSLGLKYTIEEVDKADVVPGAVSEQSPEAGTEMLTGDTVKLKVRSENIEIPFIVGKTVDDAITDLKNAGFSEENINIQETDETGPVYRSVLSVDPVEGSKASVDTQITLRVAAGTRIADITDIIASSAMVPDEYGNTYYSYNMIDGLTYTCWTDGTGDDGIGEYIDISFSPMKVSSIRVWNGYQKDSPTYGTDLYYMNNRVKDVELQFSDGSVYTCTLSDMGFASEIITLPNPVEAYSMRLVVKSVYQGTTDWHDTCISEIEILG